MSLDINALLSGRETGGTRATSLLAHFVSGSTTASLQSHLNTLTRKLTRSSLSDLLTILSSSAQLCRHNGEALVPLLTKHFQRPGLPPRELMLVCQCLALLVENSLTTSEAGRAISASASSLTSVILSIKPGQSLSSGLHLLTVLMSRYPGSCGQARTKIVDKIFSIIETGEKVERSQLGRCLSLVCQVGGGGREGVEHTAHYSAMLASLVSTIHSGVSEVFSGVKEMDSYAEIISAGAPVKLRSANLSQRARQLDSLMVVLGEMMSLGFPQSRAVPVESLLSVTVRVLMMEVEAGESPHSQLLSSLHSLLSCSSLALLTSLLTSLGQQLTFCAGQINSLLLTGLGRTRAPSVRAQLYLCLTRWLEAAGLNSGLDHCAASLVTAAVTDLRPVRQKLRLQSSAQKSKTKNKTKKKSEPEDSQEKETLDLSLALPAVGALEHLVRVVGPWLEPSSQSELTRCLLSSLLSPADPGLTSALVSCLHAVLTSPLPTSPAQLSLPLLTRLLNTPSLSGQARQCLAALNLMMQPSRLTLSTEDTTSLLLHSASEEEQEVVTELSSSSTQTSSLESARDDASDLDLKIAQERINQMESELSKARKAEASARAELLKRELEISQLKSKSEKRTCKEISEIETSAVTKKIKTSTSEEENILPSPIPPSENLADQNGDGLTVHDMLRDFSDKLNDNIVPKFTADSDSE